MKIEDYCLDTDYASFAMNYISSLSLKRYAELQRSGELIEIVKSSAIVGLNTFDSMITGKVIDARISNEERNTIVLELKEIAIGEVRAYIDGLNLV